MKDKTIKWILEKLLMGVAGEVKRGPTYQERMKGLVEIN
jgi:hypothetical protein